MYSPRQKVLWFAFSTRVFIVILQAIFNNVIPDHDAKVFTSATDPKLQISYGDLIVNKLLSGIKRWDAHYFIHIAQYGYTYENCLAFFPLFPLIVRYVAYGLTSIFGTILNFHSCLLIASTVVNMVIFIKSADILHRLSLRILKSECKAYKSVILYCVNPATVFFTVPYSEAMFAWMTFYTMLKCTENETLRFTNIDLTSGLPVGFSMITRSNGTVNLGFILYTSFKNLVERTLPEIVYKYKTLKHRIILPLLLLPLFTSFVALFLTVIIALIPFLLVQVYNYFKYCIRNDHNLPEFLVNLDYVLPGTAESPWCNTTLPVSYSYVQNHYWNVGFLRLGLRNNIFNFNCTTKAPYRARPLSRGFGANDPVLFVYVVHAMFLSIFCIFFVHIQVSTRLLASSSPILYWICCSKINIGPNPTSDQNVINEHFRRIGVGKRIPSHYLSIANLEGVDNMYSRWKTFIITRRMPDRQSRFIQYYFIGYAVIGTILYSNFYPWT